MKQKKLNKKLVLNKETIAALKTDFIRGGTPSNSQCPECPQDPSWIDELCTDGDCQSIHRICLTDMWC
jgi:hypothetical protein